MAYPTPSEIRSRLPGDDPSVTETEITLMIAEWKAQVADAAGANEAPEGDALAEAIVRRGVRGDALKQALIDDYLTETPAADAVIREARDMLARYDTRRAGPKEDKAPAKVFNSTDEPLWRGWEGA